MSLKSNISLDFFGSNILANIFSTDIINSVKAFCFYSVQLKMSKNNLLNSKELYI